MICTIKDLEDLLQTTLSEQRIAHSRRVAGLAAELCGAYGLAAEKGRIAGLAHDLAREMDPAQLKRAALHNGVEVNPLEVRYPMLLHGRVAAHILKQGFAVEDAQILEAVACHVTGCPGMGLLARIVFVADFLEPGRGFLKEEYRKTVLATDIDRMMIVVLEEIFGHLHQKGRPIAQDALDLYEELCST